MNGVRQKRLSVCKKLTYTGNSFPGQQNMIISSAHATFGGTDQMTGHKAGLTKLKELRSYNYSLSDDSAMKPEIKNKRELGSL